MLISFDGLDSSGKATQSRLLCEHLRNKGIRVENFSTPDYSTPSGKDLKLRLQNKIGNWHKTPWQEKMGLFANNRKEHKQEVLDAQRDGVVVVYDRYVPSSMVFIVEEAILANSPETREEVREAVAKLEYETNDMPREDVSIFLDVPPHFAIDLLKGRKDNNGDDDEHTDLLHVQEAMHAEYVRIAQEDPAHMMHIMCMDQGKLKSIEEVASLVRSELAKRFPEQKEYFI